jgi:membrane-bound lytic murein transglycosylase A
MDRDKSDSTLKRELARYHSDSIPWKELGSSFQWLFLLFFLIPTLSIFHFGIHAKPILTKSKALDSKVKHSALHLALNESIQYLQKLPEETNFLVLGETYHRNEILHPLQKIQKQMLVGDATYDLRSEMRVYFHEVELKTGDDLPLITGYYEVRIQGRTKPQGEYVYPALAPPTKGREEIQVTSLPREYWKDESHWKSVSHPIIFLTLTDLHLAQLEGSALVQTETNEIFRINYAADNGLDYISPSIHLTGVCPSLKPYHLSNCIKTNPKEVSDAIWKNPRYIFFEKEMIPKKHGFVMRAGPLGSGGIRLVEGRSVAMDKQIPLGFPVLLHFNSTKQTYDDHLAFVHDRGNAIQGEGRVDFYLGNGEGVEEVANQLLTKGKVVLLVPKKNKPTH